MRFSCLKCESLLERKESAYVCPGCHFVWEEREGIPVFIEEDFYWGNLSREGMRTLIKEATRTYWTDAVNERMKTQKKDFSSYIFDAQRSAWCFFCDLNQESRVLDIGSLWGTLPFSLAKECGHVTAVDAVFENCSFMETRRQQDKIENLQVVCANAMGLPFPEESFDLIVLNGVLEWVGLSGKEENPLKIQEQVLTKINRMLKKNGVLYVGIENRFGLEYFLGVKDPHSGLRFVTVLPRFLADIYSRTQRGRRYSEITHSCFGMKRLLKKCGFTRSDFFLPLPNYRHFAYLIPCESNITLRYCVRKLMPVQMMEASAKIRMFFFCVRVVAFLRCYFLLKIFSPSFGIIARKRVSS